MSLEPGTLYHHAEQTGWMQTSFEEQTAPSPLQTPSAPLRGLLTPVQVKMLPNEPYRVRGLLPRRGVAAIYVASGSGKSFLVMDPIFAIAAGHDECFGLKEKQAPIVYVALEGRGGIAKRIRAWEKHHSCAAPTGARVWLDDLTLLDPRHVDPLAQEISEHLGTGGVVVVDTLNQAAPGADENNSADMGKILGDVKLLAERIDGLVILIHHSGKDKGKGLRGHSSLIAALDASIEVINGNAGRSWKVEKTKDDVSGTTHDFNLKSYTVEKDEDGLDVTSCAIERALNHVTPRVNPPTGKCLTSAPTGQI